MGGFMVAFSPFIGLLLMVAGGLIYGRRTRKEANG
jgi:MprA protease rhombosortase-interaction domain-containing protein